MRNLQGKDFSRVELDLATETFFAQIPEFVATNRVHEQTKTSSQRRRHYAESVPVIKRYAGGVPRVASGLTMVSMVQVKKKQATDKNLFVSTNDDRLQFFGTSENAAKTRGKGGLS